MAKCKDCVTWLLVGMASTEALEHNAAVGGTLRDVGKTIKEMVSRGGWEDLISELDWFEHPITEMTADIGILGSLSELEKCDLDVSKARKLAQEGLKANREGKSALAQGKYIRLKDEIVELAKNLTCLVDGDE